MTCNDRVILTNIQKIMKIILMSFDILYVYMYFPCVYNLSRVIKIYENGENRVVYLNRKILLCNLQKYCEVMKILLRQKKYCYSCSVYSRMIVVTREDHGGGNGGKVVGFGDVVCIC